MATRSISGNSNNVHLAVVPRLCAAFNRGELLISGGDVEPSLPPTKYYTNHVNNHYSRLVHEMEADGIGYAFSYDDVAPNNMANQAGLILANNPTLMTIIVGGS